MKKNTVRILALVLVALMCLSLIPLAAHAEGHVHFYEPTTIAPTCAQNGYVQMICEACGDGGEILSWIPPTGEHSFIPVEDEEYLIEEGDCTHPYQYWKSCSVCKQSAEEAYGLAIDKLVEELNARKQSGEQADWETVAKDRVLLLDERYKFSAGGEGHHIVHVDHQEATCTSDGWKDYTYCDVCNEYFNYEAIPAKGHRWTEFKVTKAATCTEAGSQERVCEVCDEKEVQVIPALGHKGEFVVTKDFTCTEPGSQERICTVCHEKEIVAIPAAHRWGEFVVTQEPTCYSTGAKQHTCTVCGETAVEWIDMAHKYENGVCVFCGAAQPEDEKSVSESAAFKTEEPVEEPVEEIAALDNIIYISFDGNGATSGSMEAQAFEPGTTQNLSPNAFERTGYRFVGWDTMADGTGMGDEPYFADGEQVTLNADITLYAQWVEVTEAENAAVETSETAEFGAGVYTLTLTNENGKYKDQEIALVGDTITAVCETVSGEPLKEGLLYKWSRQPASGNVREEDIAISTENTYTTTNADLNGAIFCVVIDPDTNEQQRSDNLPVRAEVEISFEAENGTGSISYVRSNVDQPTIVLNPGESITYTFLTKDKITLDIEPSEGYLFRYIAYLTNSGVWSPVRTLADATRSYSFDVSTSTQKSWKMMADKTDKFVSYETDTDRPTSSADDEIKKSGIAVRELETIKKDLATQQGVDAEIISAGTIVFVTPVWDSGKLAMNNTEISKTEGFDFELPYPDDVDQDDLVIPYHFTGDSASGRWERIPESQYTADSSVKKIFVEGYKNFSPFVVLGLKNVKFILDPGEGSGTPIVETVPKGTVKTAPDCTFTEPEGKTFDKWIDENGTEYEKGATIPALENDFILTAEWKGGYRITFNKGDDNADGTMAPLDIIEGETKTLPGNKYSLKNNKFIGWSETSHGDVKFKDGEEITPDYNPEFKPVTLYAIWERTHSTITFDGNYATSGSMKEQTAPIGGSITLAKNAFKKDGKLFAGWSTNENSDIVTYEDGVTIPAPESDITLFAVWRNPVVISFYPNSSKSSDEMKTQEISSGKPTALNPNTFKATDMAFVGWNTAWDGSGKDYKDKEVVTLTGDTSLYAQWTQNTCVITFDVNGGTEDPEKPMGTQTVTKGTATPLKENTFIAPEDCIFDGWKDDDGKVYADKASFTAKNDQDEVTLHAQWKPVWKIYFDKNSSDATGTMDPLVYAKTETSTKLPANKFTRTNYKIIGWTEAQGGTTKQYDLGAAAPAKNVTLYAVWEREKVTLTLNGNNKTAPDTPDTITKSINKGAAYTLPKNTFSFPNRTFMGWNTVPNPTEENPGTSYADGAKLPASATTNNLTLYAQWDYTITFVGNGSTSGSMDMQVVKRNEKATINKNQFERTNYTFDSWNTDKDGKGDSYADQGDITTNKSVTLYAQWVKTKWSISYDKNGGGTGSGMTNTTVDNGKEGIVSANKFNPPDTSKMFGEWQATAVNEEGKTITAPVKDKDGNILPTIFAEGDSIQTFYVDGDTNTDPVNIVMKAIWQDKLDIWFYPGDATGTTTVKEYPKDSAVKLPSYSSLDFVAPANQTFAGWQLGDDEENLYKSGHKVVFGDVDKVDGDTVYTTARKVTAIWGDTITITYDPNGATASSRKLQKVAKNNDTKLAAMSQIGYTYPGYEFKGWALSSGAKVPMYLDGATVDGGFSQDTTLYAVWEQHTFVGIVTISGSLSIGEDIGYVGETLTATVTGEKVFTNFSYQWKRDGVAIDGATAETYAPTSADFNCIITCDVTANDAIEGKTKTSINHKYIYIDTSDKNIVNNGQAETDYVYGVYQGMYYSVNNGAKQPVTLTNGGVFPVTQQGIYRFFTDASSNTPVAVVTVYNWWTVGYSLSTGSGSDSSGSGSVTFKRGSTTLSSSTTIRDSAGNIILQPYTLSGYTNVWVVRADAGITDITMNVKPSSGSYGHVALNNGSYDSSSSERTISLGTITQPMLYQVVFNKSSSSPRTADMSHLGLWSALCLTSFVGAATILGSARKRKKDQA